MIANQIHAVTFIVFCIIRNPAWITRPAMVSYLGTLFRRHVIKRGRRACQNAVHHATGNRRDTWQGQAVEGRTNEFPRP